jgi:hypothetical protein
MVRSHGSDWATSRLCGVNFGSRPEAHAHGGHQEAFGGAGGVDQLAGLGRGAGERFFANDVFAGLECGQGERHMEGRGHAEVHQIHCGIRQQFVKLAVNPQSAAQVQRVGAADVAADSGQDAVDRLPHRIANGGDPGPLDFLIGPEVGGSHEAQTDDGDVDLGRRGCRRPPPHRVRGRVRRSRPRLRELR